MANLFLNLPAPSANGVGAPVDVSAMGALKSFSVTGTAVATINLEVNNSPGATGSWAPVATVYNKGGIPSIMIAARWLRVRVSGYKRGVPQVDVGSTDGGASFLSLVPPGGNGDGAAVDVSALGAYKTITVGGPFTGEVNVQISEDGNTQWSQVFPTFFRAGAVSALLAAKFMRVVRSGASGGALPVVAVGGTNDLGGGAALSSVTTDGSLTGAGTAGSPLSAVGDRMWFGNAVDGDFVTAGDFTPTMDMYFGDLTISPGDDLLSRGWRIFVAGTLTISAGSKITNVGRLAPPFRGKDAVGTGGGFAGGAGNFQQGPDGGSALFPAVGPVVGDPATDSFSGPPRTNTLQKGGAGGASAGQPSGGTDVTPKGSRPMYDGVGMTGSGDMFLAGFNRYMGGGNGGSGSADAGSTGGGGGGGGGVLFVAALHFAGTGILENRGGNGGVGTGASAGGGGGGAGGTVVVMTADAVLPTIDVAGGTGAAGSGTGLAGAAGAVGTVVAVSTVFGPLA